MSVRVLLAADASELRCRSMTTTKAIELLQFSSRSRKHDGIIS